MGRRRVAHRTRTEFAEWTPVHVTVRLVAGLPTLRSVAMARVLSDAFALGRERAGFRLVEFSVQSNHLHLIVEAESSMSLTRGMQGLMVRIARRLNKALIRRGKVFADRFHSRVLGSTVDVKNALQYVLGNARRHGVAFRGLVDPYSSAPWFDGWCEDVVPPPRPSPVVRPRTWQLTSGWRLHGRLSPFHVPGPRPGESVRASAIHR